MLAKVKSFYLLIFSGREFAKNTLTLMLGTVLAQLIPILLQPVLRRLFSPAEFGAFSVYQSLIGILTIVATFRYDLAIVLPKKDKIAANILVLAIGLNLVFSFFLFLIFIIFHYWIIELIDFPKSHAGFLLFIPAGTFLFCFYQSINFWLIRKKAFFPSSMNKVTRRASEGVAQIVSGINFTQGGLIIGDLIGNFFNSVVGVWQLFRQAFSTNFISFNKIKYVFKKYAEYPKFNLLPTLLSSCGSLIPILFINKFYNAQTVGFFDLSRQMLSIPFALISVSIAQVLLQRLTEKKNESLSIKKELSAVFWFLLVIVFFEILIILIFGPYLFALFFGDVWYTSGVYSQIMVFSFVLNFIGSSFTAVFISLDKIKLYSIWQTLYFLSIGLLLLFKNVDFVLFLKIYVAIDVFMYTFLLILIYVVVRNYEKRLNKLAC